MDFDFSDDQQQLRDAVRRWVEKGYTFDRRRAITGAGGFDRSVYAELAELGLTGLYIADTHGGTGMGPVEALVAMEELGRGMVHEPLGQALIAGAILSGYAPDALKSRWLPGIAAGDALVSLAHQERKARYRLDICDTLAVPTATSAGDGWALTGAKSLVPAGDRADGFLVPARDGDTLSLFLVENGASGVATRGYLTQDGGRAAELTLQSAPAVRVASDGQRALEHAIDIGIAATCAEAVGVLDRTFDLTAEYLNTRKQFGVTLGTFQALRHRMADMKMQLELARSMSYYASMKLNAPENERRLAMARAKVQLGTSMRFVGQNAVQLHGGIGVTDEYLGSHCLRS